MVAILEPVRRYVGVNLCRGNILVPQQLLDGAKLAERAQRGSEWAAPIAAAFQQMGGEGMTKRVRRNFLVQIAVLEVCRFGRLAFVVLLGFEF